MTLATFASLACSCEFLEDANVTQSRSLLQANVRLINARAQMKRTPPKRTEWSWDSDWVSACYVENRGQKKARSLTNIQTILALLFATFEDSFRRAQSSLHLQEFRHVRVCWVITTYTWDKINVNWCKQYEKERERERDRVAFREELVFMSAAPAKCRFGLSHPKHSARIMFPPLSFGQNKEQRIRATRSG